MLTPTPTERGRIWLLEDSALEAEMARRALATSQDVELFIDGSVVLERSATGTVPDVIVLDWHLPGISGVEVCRHLRAQNDPMSLPILMLTGAGRKPEILEALAAGANDYVTKPYDVAELVARVGTLVRASRVHRAQQSRARQLALSADIGAALTKSKNLDDIARRCANAIRTHLDATAVEVWAVRDRTLALVLSTNPSEKATPETIIRQVADTRLAHLAEDASGAALSGRHTPAGGFAALPLVVQEEVLGVIAICTPRPIADSDEVLRAVADLVALGIARARTEEERLVLLDRERATRADAEAANRSKDEFLAMVSHELRTPLNAITGWTTMLLSGNLPADRVERALQTIDRSARSQAQLIDDLLDISRIVSGKLRLNVGSVDVPSVAEMALESVRLGADAKGVAIDAAIASDAGRITGDVDRIQQVIWNLLTNALKFTPKGGRVLLAVTRDGDRIVILVQDSGQGIGADFLPYVFERFKQADGTTTRMKGGLGLGLAIVKHIVELHGGTIEASSEGVERGSRFQVVLPVNAETSDGPRPSLRVNADSPAIERPRELEGLRVLIVDDEPDARELLRTLLESCKVVVTTAGSAAEAFEAVRTTKLDVILSDIAMPEEDGLSLIKRVRALPREEGGRVAAVALTAYARLEDRTRALRAGFNSHVAKPVEANELLAVLSSFANR